MLKISNLSVAYRQNNTLLMAVRDFSLEITAGQTYGLVGESGSGKTTVAMALLRYLGTGGQIVAGEIEFNGRDLLTLSASELSRLWGREIALVPQDPLSSLNPSIRIGEQIGEALRHHFALSAEDAAARSLEMLTTVRVPDPERVARSYPHEISGGMQQRILIAIALSADPKLIILDEPTTSLDVTTQAAVLDLLRDLIRDRQMAVLYITHNLGVVARMCDRVAVLYAGELVEDAPTRTLFSRPLHPYSQGLMDSIPKLGQSKVNEKLTAIPGQIPSLADRTTGCVFATRCALAVEMCFVERPSLDAVSSETQVRCHRWPEIVAGTVSGNLKTLTGAGQQPHPNDDEVVLEIKDVKVEFPITRSLADSVAARPRQSIKAVDGISLSIQRGHTLGVVGESGSGKSTLARAVVGLVEPTNGTIELFGLELPSRLTRRERDTLRRLQYVFQNPEEALNPYLTIGETLTRPFITLLGQTSSEARTNAQKLLSAVGLPADYSHRLPGQLSGGEKQRVAIARAFAASPGLIIADEPVSSLDVSVQAAILKLMGDLQHKNNNTMMFISHDLAVVGYLADRIAVLYGGQIMELAEASELFKPPYHPYTEALLSAVPSIDPSAVQRPMKLEGDIPSQIDVPGGCRFHLRCPHYLGDICREQAPPWQLTDRGSGILCHIPLPELQAQQEQMSVNKVGGRGE